MGLVSRGTARCRGCPLDANCLAALRKELERLLSYPQAQLRKIGIWDLENLDLDQWFRG